jgi:hypothetical protein
MKRRMGHCTQQAGQAMKGSVDMCGEQSIKLNSGSTLMSSAVGTGAYPTQAAACLQGGRGTHE